MSFRAIIRTWKDNRCHGCIINRAFRGEREMVWVSLVSMWQIEHNISLVRCSHFWNICEHLRSCNILYLSSCFFYSISARYWNDVWGHGINTKNENCKFTYEASWQRDGPCQPQSRWNDHTLLYIYHGELVNINPENWMGMVH